MSQYCSRLNIRIKEKETWQKLQKVNFEKYGISQKFIDDFAEDYVIDSDWSCGESSLYSLVNSIVNTVGQDIIVVADTTNIDSDVYNYCVYYIGGNVKDRYFTDDSPKANMFFETNINKIEAWLKYGGFRIYDKELDLLHSYGYMKDIEKKEKSLENKILSNNIDHKPKYISKINILVPDLDEWKGLPKNFFKQNGFQYCFDIADAKEFFKNYNKKSLCIENGFEIDPKKMMWFCLRSVCIDSIILIETRKNTKSSKTECYCSFPYPNKATHTVFDKPLKANISEVEKWLKEAKVRMTPNKKKILEQCLEEI